MDTKATDQGSGAEAASPYDPERLEAERRASGGRPPKPLSAPDEGPIPENYEAEFNKDGS